MKVISKSILLVVLATATSFSGAGVAQVNSQFTADDREQLKQQLQQIDVTEREELSEAAKARRTEFFTNADANRDGTLTKDELNSSIQSRFERMDRNGNGVANKDDAPRFARDRYMTAVGPIIEQFDTNGDDSLSRDEFSAGFLAGFDRFDDDGDGSVELDAMVAALEQGATSL